VFCCGRRCPPRRLCWPHRASSAQRLPHRPIRPRSGSPVTAHQLCPRLSWRTPTTRLTSRSAVCNSQAGTRCTWCIFYGDISPSHLASSHALGPDASCCATAALSAPLADTTLAVPSARAGAANDPHRLYTSTPEGQLPSRLCIFTASLSLFVYVPLVYACQGPIDSPHVRVDIHSRAPLVNARGVDLPRVRVGIHSPPPRPSFMHANARGVDRVRASVRSRLLSILHANA
jgi:hypothetical protein